MKLGLQQARQLPPGEIDYRLARQSLLDRYRRGEVARNEVCDAQSELLRNAEFCGQPIDGTCPVCDAEPMRRVVYVFGPRLPSGGRCISTSGELARLARRTGHFRAYAVEVCLVCGWNHLQRSWYLAEG